MIDSPSSKFQRMNAAKLAKKPSSSMINNPLPKKEGASSVPATLPKGKGSARLNALKKFAGN